VFPVPVYDEISLKLNIIVDPLKRFNLTALPPATSFLLTPFIQTITRILLEADDGVIEAVRPESVKDVEVVEVSVP
jgi:hypothetical protein